MIDNLEPTVNHCAALNGCCGAMHTSRAPNLRLKIFPPLVAKVASCQEMDIVHQNGCGCIVFNIQFQGLIPYMCEQ